MCTHQPQCPRADDPDHALARVVAAHPEQGWSLLCNHVVLFDDGHAIEPTLTTSRAGFHAIVHGLKKGTRECFRIVAVGASASSAPTSKVCTRVK